MMRAVACLSVALASFLACQSPAPSTTAAAPPVKLTYREQEGDNVLELKGNPAWQPAWNDTLVARLERGALPAYQQNGQTLPAVALPKARQVRGLVLSTDANGHAQDDGVLLLPARTVIAVLVPNASPPALDLYFYDASVSLQHFYARVHQADVKKLIGHPLEFAAAP